MYSFVFINQSITGGSLSMPDESVVVALLYIVLGLFGFFCNIVVVVMISSVTVYHKSAYILMANIALADAIQSLIVGCYTGFAVLTHTTNVTDEMMSHEESMQSSNRLISLITITAWFVMIYTYAVLGMNRCVSTCFYKTRLRKFNRLQCTRMMIIVVWVISVIGGFAASFPQPIIVVQVHIWTMRFLNKSLRSKIFILFNISVNAGSIISQWICSGFVLNTVRKIHKRISTHSMNSAKMRHSQRQMRLSFQFFYPSAVCTLSSIMFFSMPLYAHLMSKWHFFISHLVWLINHLCNPLIYAYFNGRMRETIGLWLRCERDNGNSFVEKGRATTAYRYSVPTNDRRSTREMTLVVRNSSTKNCSSVLAKKQGDSVHKRSRQNRTWSMRRELTNDREETISLQKRVRTNSPSRNSISVIGKSAMSVSNLHK